MDVNRNTSCPLQDDDGRIYQNQALKVSVDADYVQRLPDSAVHSGVGQMTFQCHDQRSCVDLHHRGSH